MRIENCTRCGARLRCVYVNASPPLLCGGCMEDGLTADEEEVVLAKLAVKFVRNSGLGGEG